MFYTLCIALFFAVMFLTLVASVSASVLLARLLSRMLRNSSPAAAAGILFCVRMWPFAFSAVVSFGLVLPAFLKFEPASTGEMVSWHLLALAGLGLAALLTVLIRIAGMLRTTVALEHDWIRHGTLLEVAGLLVPVYCVSEATSLLAISGFVRPRIFVSRDVSEALDHDELAAALAHELAHMRALDNLKQLLLRSTQLPLRTWRRLDATWSSTSEMAADEGAVRQGASALELSSALIKVGRLSVDIPPFPGFAVSHLVPGDCQRATRTRVVHLTAMLESEAPPECATANSGTLAAMVLVTIIAYAAAIATLLPAVHEFLEFLVR
jgi:peptidase M48-like protein